MTVLYFVALLLSNKNKLCCLVYGYSSQSELRIQVLRQGLSKRDHDSRPHETNCNNPPQAGLQVHRNVR